MAPRQNPQGDQRNVDRNAAEDTVFGNLDLDMNELGAGENDNLDLTDDEPADLDGGDDNGVADDDLGGDDDLGSDPFDPSGVLRTQNRGDKDRERVSHTERKPLPRRSEVKPDKKGNLLNAKGEIVARSGREARMYQSRERARRDLSAAQSENTELRGQLHRLAGAARQLHEKVKGYEATEGKLKELGLRPQDQLTAMQLFAEMESNPEAAVKRILTRAAARGIDVTKFGVGGGAFDVKSLSDLVRGEVEKVVNPLKERSEKQAKEEEDRAARQLEEENATKEVRAFFARNPEAREFAPVFVRVMGDPRYRGYSLGEIYAKILSHPNLTALRGRQRSRTPGREGMPRGRGMAPTGSGGADHPSTSYEAIIGDVLNKAGIGNRQSR